MENGTQNGSSRWRFSKDIPISVVLFLIAQTVTGAMFLAVQNKTLSDVVLAFKEFSLNAYTKEDARREREFQDQKELNATQRSNEILRRIGILESQQGGPRIGVGINR